jgi:hypothetical protein
VGPNLLGKRPVPSLHLHRPFRLNDKEYAANLAAPSRLKPFLRIYGVSQMAYAYRVCPRDLGREISLLTHRLANKLPPTLKASSLKHRAATVGLALAGRTLLGTKDMQRMYLLQRGRYRVAGRASVSFSIRSFPDTRRLHDCRST